MVMRKRGVLNDEQARSLAAFRDVRIVHDGFQDALARISNFHLAGRYSDSPGVMSLIGYTGAGKTSIIKEYCRTHNKKGEFKKVLSIVVPENCTVKNLASRILSAIGDPRPTHGTREDMENRIKYYSDRTQVELIVFDEFQHISVRGSSSRQYDAADWIKTQVEVLKKPILFSGLPEVENIFVVNPQLETRRKGKIQLSPFSLKSEEGREAIHLFFHSINQRLPLPKPDRSALLEAKSIRLLVSSSNGVLGYMMRVVHLAAELAILERRQTLLYEHLTQALEELPESQVSIKKGMMRPVAVLSAASYRRATKAKGDGNDSGRYNGSL